MALYLRSALGARTPFSSAQADGNRSVIVQTGMSKSALSTAVLGRNSNQEAKKAKCMGTGSFRRERHRQASASRNEIPMEVLEDSKFVPISEVDDRFGPPAMLLMGFRNEEATKVQSFLKEIDGDFLKILLCTEEMVKGTLGDAVNSVQSNLLAVQVAAGLPRVCVLSGLSGEEIMMLIDTFPESGLDTTVFAAHVPKNTSKPLDELVEEIMGDHERLSKPQ